MTSYRDCYKIYGMLKVSLKYESESMIDAFKTQISDAFPDRDAAPIFEVLNDYDEAYFAAREYFAYFFSMTTNTVVDYVNRNGLGRIWHFMTDSVFDGGVNALYRFYDPSSKKNEKILDRCMDCIGVSISSIDKNDALIKMLVRNRNNMAAHYGNDFGLDSSRISYDAPILILERLRRDKIAFDKKYIGKISFLDDDILQYFLTMIPPVIALLKADIDRKTIEEELELYINSIIKVADECSMI